MHMSQVSGKQRAIAATITVAALLGAAIIARAQAPRLRADIGVTAGGGVRAQFRPAQRASAVASAAAPAADRTSASLRQPALTAQAQAFAEPERGLLFSALASRPHHAAALLDSIAAKKLPRATLTPPVVEKIRALGDEALTKRLDALPPAAPEPAKKRAKKSTH